MLATTPIVWYSPDMEKAKLYEAMKIARSREKKRAIVHTYEGYSPSEKVLSGYGLRQLDYDRLLARQGGACAICFNDGEPLVIDHDHIEGSVRGLLCNSCNSMLGFARDDTRILRSAIQYLISHLP